MAIKAILFDLDGTLLPMDQDVYIKAYFGGMVKKLAPLGYAPDSLVGAIWKGTEAMTKNDGTATNEARFWDTFCQILGEKARQCEKILEEFYKNEFQSVKEICGFAPESREIIDILHDRGMRTVLATNPVFPKVATDSRIRWAGLKPEDFELVTTFENSSYTKPNPRYYEDILKRCALLPEECVMVGNDVSDDMVAADLGMKVFLLTDCLINAKSADVSAYPQGGFKELIEFLNNI